MYWEPSPSSNGWLKCRLQSLPSQAQLDTPLMGNHHKLGLDFLRFYGIIILVATVVHEAEPFV